MTLKEENGKLKLVESKRDISFMHKPFVSKVEGIVESVLAKVGSKKI
jgi:hypothetical protein